MIRVLVVDDHELIREAVSVALAAAGDIDVVGSSVDGYEALDAVPRTRPDVVVMDLSMPGMDGRQATRSMLQTNPAIRVVIFTSAPDGPQVTAALKIGAVACVFKGAGLGELLRVVREAAHAA